MPVPSDWTDADFVPRDDVRTGTAEQEVAERRERYRSEICARLRSGDTREQVIDWLVSEGVDRTAAEVVVGWAAGAPPTPVTLYVEVEYEDGHTNTDPVESARARAAARKRRQSAQAPVPVEGCEFARPSDAMRVRHDNRHTAVWALVGAVIVLLVLCGLVAAVLN